MLADAREGTDARGRPCTTDECAIASVTHAKLAYAKPANNGNVYFGRGLIQLTHADNYRKVGAALGWGSLLYDNPTEALTPCVVRPSPAVTPRASSSVCNELCRSRGAFMARRLLALIGRR